MKMQSFILTISLNYSITVLEFFHWLTSRSFISASLIFSNITLLTLPNSHFQGPVNFLYGLLELWRMGFLQGIPLFQQGLVFRYVFGFQTDWTFDTFCWLFVCLCHIFSRRFLYCSGGALYILLVLSAKMKTSGEEFILEIFILLPFVPESCQLIFYTSES